MSKRSVSRTLDRPNFRMGFPCQKLNYSQWLQPSGGQGAEERAGAPILSSCPQLQEFLCEEAQRKARNQICVLYSTEQAYPWATSCLN